MEADASLKKALEIEPDNPTGYALEAMLHLFAYEMCFTIAQQKKEREAIIYYSEEALLRGEKNEWPRIAATSQVYLAVALAKIAKVHWAIKEKKILGDGPGDIPYLEVSRNGRRLPIPIIATSIF